LARTSEEGGYYDSRFSNTEVEKKKILKRGNDEVMCKAKGQQILE
jgi:hypothetical protein